MKFTRIVDETLPEGLCPFTLSVFPDGAKKFTLCDLCVSVVNMFSNESREGRVGRFARFVFVLQALSVAILKA